MEVTPSSEEGVRTDVPTSPLEAPVQQETETEPEIEEAETEQATEDKETTNDFRRTFDMATKTGGNLRAPRGRRPSDDDLFDDLGQERHLQGLWNPLLLQHRRRVAPPQNLFFTPPALYREI